MHILVTNDDGIRAPGINALARALTTIGKVTVVAPDRERSATGHAITVHQPLRADPILLDDQMQAYQVSGTPSDCVKLALETLLSQRPDVLVSGINRGANLGTDVIYSGTVSAAVEGTILGVPSIAVSLDSFVDEDYDYAGKVAAQIVQRTHESDLPSDTLLNVNVPHLQPHEVAGVQITRLGIRRYRDVFHERQDPRGNRYFWLAGDVVDEDDDPENDAFALTQGYVSVTPVHFDLTKYDAMPLLQGWSLSLPDG